MSSSRGARAGRGGPRGVWGDGSPQDRGGLGGSSPRLAADRGSSAIELAFLGPALIILTLLIIQFALWFDAGHAALAAAREGDLVAREDAFANPQGWSLQAQTAATSYYRGLDTSVLSRFKTMTSRKGDTVSVTVSGTVTGIFPLPVAETVSGPIECFRTEASQGAACG